jgi:hypothetical protein
VVALFNLVEASLFERSTPEQHRISVHVTRCESERAVFNCYSLKLTLESPGNCQRLLLASGDTSWPYPGTGCHLGASNERLVTEVGSQGADSRHTRLRGLAPCRWSPEAPSGNLAVLPTPARYERRAEGPFLVFWVGTHDGSVPLARVEL